jgi:DNA-binding NarL/FixJ family response regulator
MKTNIWKVTLDEITPEKIIEIENYLLDQRLVSLTRNNMREFGEYRKMLSDHMDRIEADCKMRVLRAISIGLDIKEIAEDLQIPAATIRRWIKPNN